MESLKESREKFEAEIEKANEEIKAANELIKSYKAKLRKLDMIEKEFNKIFGETEEESELPGQMEMDLEEKDEMMMEVA